MFELLLTLTASVLVVTMIVAYQKTRDVLHPALFIGPLFLYGAVLDPWLVRHHIEVFFPDPERMTRVLVLTLLAVTGLSCGLLHKIGDFRRVVRAYGREQSLLRSERRQLHAIGFVMAIAALASYSSGIVNVGGFDAAFSQAKGGGHTVSGYISEAMSLGLVAAVMVALSQYRRGLDGQSLLLLTLSLLPNLVQGTFGGRRGPLFLAIAAGSMAWMLTRARRPRFWMLAGCLLLACVAVTFVWSQRRHLYLGSPNAEVRWDKFFDTLTQENVEQGNNFIYGAAYVLAMEDSGKFTWGKALAVDLLVRPIPKQLWPTKYADTGATWITSDYPGLGPLTPQDWLATVGWLPSAGSAAISIADVFGEFGWWAVLVFYLIGRGFNWLYLRGRLRGGVWTLLSLEALLPSIYLATQSFSAFYSRYLILAIPTIIGWRFVTHARQNLARIPNPRNLIHNTP